MAFSLIQQLQVGPLCFLCVTWSIENDTPPEDDFSVEELITKVKEVMDGDGTKKRK